MKILITGTNGFIGRNLKEYLHTRYEDVYCPKREKLNLLDCDAVYEYLHVNTFDVIIHCGVSLTSVEENLKMYFNIERCSEFFGLLFSLGSGAEYDRYHYIPKMKETYFGQFIPNDIYGFSKYVMAKDIESKPRNIINLRLFGIFGKYEDYHRRFISNNICRVLSNLHISVNKNMYFDFLYVDDFSKIVEMLIKKAPKKQSYNICTGNSIDLLSLAEIIQRIDGKGAPITIKESGLNPEYSGDNTRFLNEYGHVDFSEPEKAITELYCWYKDSSQLSFGPNIFN